MERIVVYENPAELMSAHYCPNCNRPWAHVEPVILLCDDVNDRLYKEYINVSTLARWMRGEEHPIDALVYLEDNCSSILSG